MNPIVVQCSSCRTEFELDPTKVPAEGVRARCSVCSAVITVPPPPVVEAPRQREEMPAWESEPAPPPPPPTAERVTRESIPEPRPAPPQPVSRPTPARGVALGIPVPADHTTVQKSPINPFLSKDPGLRAKRLARALVSDIVAYHPARHTEGLRDGTLKTLFRDEIKKSYDEYVDQVGRELAESTSHFKDALNDVLAAGKKLF
jgi:predicted Zn finger-like uncharacterized protein